MQRRKFMYGLGAATAGSSVLLGSSAFTTGSLNDREADIDVVSDNYGVIRLVDMLPDSDILAEGSDGRLRIDFTAGGASGVNTGGHFQLGGIPDGVGEGGELEENYWSASEFDFLTDPGGSPNAAFGIENRGTQTYDLTLEYEADEAPGGARLEVYVFNGNLYAYEGGPAPISDPSFVIEDGNESDSVTIDDDEPSIRQYNPEKRVFVSLAIDTKDVDDPADANLSGVMNIHADNPR